MPASLQKFLYIYMDKSPIDCAIRARNQLLSVDKVTKQLVESLYSSIFLSTYVRIMEQVLNAYQLS